MSESRLVTLWQIAEATGRGKTTVQYRARREHWKYSLPPCGYRGGRPARLYDPADLPADVRSALGERPPELPGGQEGPPPRRGGRAESELVARGADRLRRAGVLQAVWADAHGWGRSRVSKAWRGQLAGARGQARAIVLALRKIGAGGPIPDLDELRAESARRLSHVDTVGRAVRAPAPPPRRTTRIPEGHPSRYRTLKPSRIPDWARGLGASCR